MGGKQSRRREFTNSRPQQRVRARDRRTVEKPVTTREGVAQAVQDLAAEPEVSEQAQRTTTVLWRGIEDRDRALGDLYVALEFVLEESDYRFVGKDKEWLAEIIAKTMTLAGSEVCGERAKEQQ